MHELEALVLPSGIEGFVVGAAAGVPVESRFVDGFVEGFDMEAHEELFLAEVIMSNDDNVVTGVYSG